MAFRNRIRLPFYLTRPQFPTTRNVFRKANGVTQTISTEVRKTYEGETDSWKEQWHQYFQMALAHDNVRIETQRYFGNVAQDGDYEIEWQEFLDFPIAKAKFKVQVTPFDATNSNCQTCEEALQLSLEDDYLTTVYTSILEGSLNNYNVLANDSIFCSPFSASIFWFNTTYVDSASIDAATGIITIQLKATTPSGDNVKLATYRVTCSNGSYDDADVYANVEGTEITCQEIDDTTIEITHPDSQGVVISWAEIVGATGYDYQLYNCSDLGTPIATGNVSESNAVFNDLDPGGCYLISIKTICAYGESEFVSVEFNQPIASTCARYMVFKDDGSGIPGNGFYIFSYIRCDGLSQNDFITNLQYKPVCALESSYNVPVSITGVTSYERIADC